MTQLAILEAAAPPTPPAGYIVLYAKTDSELYIKDDTGAETAVSVAGAGDFKADGTVPATGDFNLAGFNIDNLGVLFLLEQAAADADLAGSGQIWVKNTEPNELWFTNDVGTHFQLGVAAGGGDAWSDPVDAIITPDGDGTRDLGLTGTRFAEGFFDDLDVTTNIIVGGTVDGRDVAADGTKLDGVSGSNTGDEPDSSATVKGIVELATIAEVDTGTDATRAVTPDSLEGSALQIKVDGISGTNTGDEPNSSATVKGIVELATITEIDTGTDTVRAITPAGLAGSALQATADAALPKAGGQVSGNITMAGAETVDGRDLSADGTKLDGIESSATADQSDGEIKTAYENNADTNEYSDAEQTTVLSVENNADVTDATNVAGAGAVMDGDFSGGEGFMRKTGAGAYEVIKSNLGAAVAPTVNEDSGDGYVVGSLWIDTTADKAYVCLDATVASAVWIETTGSAGGGDSWGDVVDAIITPDGDGTRDFGLTGTRFATAYVDDLDVTDNIIVGGTVDGRDVATDGTKLDGIAAGATDKPIESLIVALGDETTDLTTGTGKITWRMAYAFTVTEVRADVEDAPTGSTAIIDINEGGTSILSTKISIDATEETSETAATPPVISDASLADNARMTADIDQIGSSNAGKGLKITLIGTRT